jgi:hypothetical protein
MAIAVSNFKKLALATTLAFVQRRQNSLAREHSGDDIDHRDADAHRIAIRLTRQAHQPTFALHDGIVARTVLVRPIAPIAGNRAINDTRIGLRDRRVAETVSVHHTGAEIFDQNVGFTHQFQNDFTPLGRSDIERDTLFVAVNSQKIRRNTMTLGYVRCTNIVTLRHGAIRSRQDARQVENAQALKRRAGTSGTSCRPFIFRFLRHLTILIVNIQQLHVRWALGPVITHRQENSKSGRCRAPRQVNF